MLRFRAWVSPYRTRHTGKEPVTAFLYPTSRILRPHHGNTFSTAIAETASRGLGTWASFVSRGPSPGVKWNRQMVGRSVKNGATEKIDVGFNAKVRNNRVPFASAARFVAASYPPTLFQLMDHLMNPCLSTLISVWPDRGRPGLRITSLFLLVFAAIPLEVSQAAAPKAADALKLKPVQKDIQYEEVPRADIGKCAVEPFKSKGVSGWRVVGPDGAVLREFADSNDDEKIDRWSYYAYGVEIYRDMDADFDGKADQYRWLGTGGTRWGIDEDEDGVIDYWKRISAEEVSSELVAALRQRDTERFERLLITPRELKQLGLGKTKTQKVAGKASRAAREFGSVAKRQEALGRNAKWIQFAASTPGVIPAGTDGSSQDVVAYENAIAMYADGDENGQLVVGTLIKVNDVWRLIDLPSISQDGDTIAQVSSFFGSTASRSMTGAAEGGGEETQRLVSQLEKIDAQFAKAKSKKEIARLHEQRTDLIEALIDAAPDPNERETWVRQLVDTLNLAVQGGAYPDGVKRLRTVARKHAGKNKSLQAYADFEAINAEYVVKQTPEADFVKVQEWYLESLSGFVDRYPKSLEAAKAYLQMAFSKEFEDKEKEALRYYKKVTKSFAGTAAAERAEGAVRRLESVGHTIELEGSTLDGKSFRLSALRGKPVVIHYWATWCGPCKQDMKLLSRLQSSYRRAGLQIVGVNVDGVREEAVAFMKENKLPWTQLFEPGGLESSRLAKVLGVQTLPTTLLIDQRGKVVRHNVRVDELDDELEQMLKR